MTDERDNDHETHAANAAQTEEREEEMTHPAAFTLDAVAAGDSAGAVAAHLAVCTLCAEYVAKLRAEAGAFRARTDAAAFRERIAARAAASVAAAPRAMARPGPHRLARVARLAAPVLAAAAAIALWVRSSGSDLPPEPGVVEVTPGAGTHFKGGVSVVAIRERDGIQQRLSGPFEVAPSDRVRIEVAIDRDEPITAGLLSDDGTWASLLAPTALEAGTHFSELAARFDDTPTAAVLLVGAPDDVARARETRRFEGVVAWRIRSEPKE